MARKRPWLMLFVLGACLVPFSMGGCEMECDCNDKGIKEVIDEAGDEVEDVIDKAKEDK